MQIGEGVAIALVVDKPSAVGSLEVTILEHSSDEAVEGVSVALSGPSGGNGKTDSNGKAKFPGLQPGTYTVTVEQAEFELRPKTVAVLVGPGASEKLEMSVRRVILSLVLKRMHVKGILKGMSGDKGAIDYGHWWVEIDDAESYGWWPGAQVSLRGTFVGVSGDLNGTARFGGTPTMDPHHGDPAEEMFHPLVANGKPASAIKDCVRAYARGYSGKWSWPWGQNCHSFQEAMMKHCGLKKSGSKKAS